MPTRAEEAAGKYGALYEPKWAVFILAPFSASGRNEILATFRTKQEARDWMSFRFPKKNQQRNNRRDIGLAHYSRFKVKENGNG